MQNDQRYTIAKEWCGYRTRRFVARFCGEYIGQDKKESGAHMLCIAHSDKRSCPHCGAPNCQRNHMAENTLKDALQNNKEAYNVAGAHGLLVPFLRQSWKLRHDPILGADMRKDVLDCVERLRRNRALQNKSN